MLKKFASILLILVMVLSLGLTGCNKAAEVKETPTKVTTEETADVVEEDAATDEVADVEEDKAEPVADPIKVGMVTDAGTIDDKSFNQGTWEGIKMYEDKMGTIVAQYLQPEGTSETDYINAITNLADTGHSIIVTPGFKFETAIFAAQDIFPDVQFILIDGSPHNADYSEFRSESNVVSIFFNEHEAGFLAGVAAALESETGKLGFIGGMEIPAVQRFGWGYVAGVKYANDTYGTTAEVVNYIYQGTFDDLAAGQQLASGMYDDGIDTIFTAAGGVGVGAINEAKGRASNGEAVMIVGVDVDQYSDGIYDDENSIMLTSAVKKIGVAAYDYIDAALNGSFPGGEIITMTLADNAVGLPAVNPNLSDDTSAKTEEVEAALLSGDIVAPSTAAEVNEFLGTEFAAE